MKKNFIIICMLVLSCTAFGQQIKNKNIEFDDLLKLLNAAGYESFNYDISEMLNDRYNITITLKEHEAEKEIASTNRTTVPNKRLLTDIPEPARQGFIDAGAIIDEKTQAITYAEKISFGFYPSDNDSTKRMLINVSDFARSTSTLQLRGLPIKDSNKLLFSYQTRPFKIKEFKEGEFIPLILLGSVWYDERFGAFRFCAEREIEPDLSSEILKYVPHYYTIGVTFTKM